MGNQLVGKAQKIYPVEHYIQDLTDFKIKFQSSPGSTRFFKVAKCDTEAGPVVVKVFVIQKRDARDKDNIDNIDYASHKKKILELKDILAPTFNCLPFCQAEVTENAAFIVRQFGKYSLFDRIITRPFLTNLEKKWLAFQLLLAVEQCHNLGVCHGDIKLENILVSSWLWLTLTDFASFKPTFLPVDNPADYAYFFDTSRRRVCYIAPERFVQKASNLQADDGVDVNNSGQLQKSMDVFSVGCCIGEIFTDGDPVFDFSNLLSYKANDNSYDPSTVLMKIDDVDIRNLVTHMINRDPDARLTVSEYLEEQRGKVFPENFYTFLQSYIKMFSREPLMSSDQKIQRIYKDLPYFQTLLDSSDPSQVIDTDCLLVVTNIVISCVRSLVLTRSHLLCLEILQWLSSKMSSEVILERILPQLMHFLGGPAPCVTARAVSVLVTSLGHVSHVPRSDANTFPELILPVLSPLSSHPSVSVRCALAKHLATIAQLSTTWLDMIISTCNTCHAATDYHSELATLHKFVVTLVTTLLEDSVNSVKQVLVTESSAKLAVWFGRQKATDVLLSHMITFLNDKEDSQLRFCFYDNIAGVASFVGWHCSSTLKPLLEQGLADTEEMVVCRTITAIADLVSLGLLEKVSIFEMLKMTSPFLLHPNLWIRQATVGLVVAVAGKLDNVDIQVKLSSVVSPFLRQSLVQIDVPHLLLSHVTEPVPRPVLEHVVKYQDTRSLLDVLEERQTARKLARVTGSSGSHQPVYPEMNNQLKQLFGRLADAGMLPAVEDKVLALRDYILKVSKAMKVKEADGLIKCDLDEAELKKTEKFTSDEPRRSDSGEEWMKRDANKSENEMKILQAPCKIMLKKLFSEKKGEFNSIAARRERVDSIASNVAGRGGWKPRGVLVAHLAEHKGGVTRLTSVPDTTLVASTSTDGTLRIWDVAKIESGRNIANKSRQVYNKQSPLDGVAASSHNQCLATAARDGAVSVFNIEEQRMVASRSINLEDEGSPVDLVFCDLATSPLLFYCTTFGSIIGWDIRDPNKNAVTFSQDLRHGLTTAMCVAGEETWLAAGTSSGIVTIWDLRFRLQVGGLSHPNKARVRRLDSMGPGQLVMSVQGNNEVGLWNVESSSRQTCVMSAVSGAQHSVTAFSMMEQDRFITGGTDCKIRYWSLAPTPETLTLGQSEANVSSLSSKLVEGSQVYTEVGPGGRAASGGRGGRGDGDGGGRIQADGQHSDWVTDMTLCRTQQTLLVTASNDGVVKIWK